MKSNDAQQGAAGYAPQVARTQSADVMPEEITQRVVSPPLTELERLRTPLTNGESAFLRFLLQYLPPAWEIYIQPHLNGLRPDFGGMGIPIKI